MTPKQKQQAIAGVALIVLGLALYYLPDLGSSAIFVLVGGAFLAAYFWRREFGFLIPGCILLGLAGAQIFDRSPWIALGSGFVAITVIGLAYERQFRFWPLIPGTVLILLGLRRTEDLLRAIARHWPLLLVAAGAMIVVAAFFRKSNTRPAG